MGHRLPHLVRSLLNRSVSLIRRACLVVNVERIRDFVTTSAKGVT